LVFFDILSQYQHGFRKNHSYQNQLIGFIDDLHYLIEKHRQVDVMFLDFAKTFDKVPHNRLLLKLSNYRIQGQVYDWIKGWLINRYQRVIIDSKSSSSQPVLSGVRQNMVLGPLMFLIFINDVTTGITSHIQLFANECIIYQPRMIIPSYRMTSTP